MKNEAECVHCVAWVIEIGDAPLYWNGKPSVADCWTPNNLDAIRFARKYDAETVRLKLLGHQGISAEHEWCEDIT